MSGTTFFENDIWASVNHVLANGGAVFTDRTAFAAAGTGTARASMTTTYQVPSVAKELIAIKPFLSGGVANVAANLCFAKFDIIGTNYAYQPTEVIGPISGPVLASGSMQPSPQEWWTVRARANAGDTYDYGVTPLVANANNMRAGYELMWATEASLDAPIASQLSTASTFTTAGAQTASTITPTNAKYLYEVASAVVGPGVITTAQPGDTFTNIQSAGFSPIQSFNYSNETPGLVVSTTGQASVLGINRVMPLGIKFTIPNAVVNYAINNDVLLSAAANAVHCLRYIKGQ